MQKMKFVVTCEAPDYFNVNNVWSAIQGAYPTMKFRVTRDAELRNEAASGTGESPVSEQPTGDDVPRFAEWECLCGELYPVTFVKCPFCHAERPGIYQ